MSYFLLKTSYFTTFLSSSSIHPTFCSKPPTISTFSIPLAGEGDGTLSDQFSFTVPPIQDGNTHTFMVYGDLGTRAKDMQFLLQEALNEKYEAIFHVGDIAYNLSSEGVCV